MFTGRLCGGSMSIRCPRSVIVPSVGTTKPPIRFSVVVLPQPEGPSRQKNSPSRISRSSAAQCDVLPVALDHSVQLDAGAGAIG